MKTALVIEIRGRSAVVMKTGGEFAAVRAKRDWAEGDIVSIREQDNSFRALYAAAACLAVVLIGVFGVYNLYSAETALVSIDVNPSIELGLNRYGRVVSTTYYNIDGEKVLSSLDLHGKKYDAALASLFESEAFEPYLRDNGYLDIIVSGRDLKDAVEERIEQQAKHFANLYGLRLNCQRADADTIAAAHEYGMTPGRYLAFQELQSLDPNVKIGDYCSCGLGSIREEVERLHQNQNGQQGDHIAAQDQSAHAGGHSSDDQASRDQDYAAQNQAGQDGQEQAAQDQAGQAGYEGEHAPEGPAEYEPDHSGATPAPAPTPSPTKPPSSAPPYDSGGGSGSSQDSSSGGSNASGHH